MLARLWNLFRRRRLDRELDTELQVIVRNFSSSSSSRRACSAPLGTPLVAGRDFAWADVYDKRAVVLISENLARRDLGFEAPPG